MAQMQTEKLPEYLKEKVTEAQARLKTIEGDAQKLLKEIKARGKASRKELDGLLTKVSSGEFMDRVKAGEQAGRAKVAEVAKKVKTSELGVRAFEIQKELLVKLDELQRRVLDVVGVASRDQVSELTREIHKLSKRVEKIARRGVKRMEA